MQTLRNAANRTPILLLIARDRIEDRLATVSAELLARRETDFALSPTQSGTGLGLAIVNMVARLHGGMLRLENRVEGGARVTVTFAP